MVCNEFTELERLAQRSYDVAQQAQITQTLQRINRKLALAYGNGVVDYRTVYWLAAPQP
jgi:hypothetical protein